MLGGWDRFEQHFNPMTTGSSFNELVLSMVALILPTAITSFDPKYQDTMLIKVSRAEAVLLFLSYLCYIYYSFGSHAKFFKEPHQKAVSRVQKWRTHTGDAEKGFAQAGAGLAAVATPTSVASMISRRTQRVPLPKISSPALALTLVIDTVVLGYCSTFAVDSIDGLTQKTILTQDFVGLILLPLLSCNLHAIALARKDEMPQSFAISISSSIQLLLCILPLAVIIGWIRNDSNMSLLLDPFQVISLAVSIMILRYITDDGKSNWYVSDAA